MHLGSVPPATDGVWKAHDLPAGEYELQVWTPLLPPHEWLQTQSLVVGRLIGSRFIQIETRVAARAGADQRQARERLLMRRSCLALAVSTWMLSQPALAHEITAQIDLRAVVVDSPLDSFTEGGTGQLRFGGDDDGLRLGSVMIDAAGEIVDTIRYGITARATGMAIRIPSISPRRIWSGGLIPRAHCVGRRESGRSMRRSRWRIAPSAGTACTASARRRSTRGSARSCGPSAWRRR